MKTKKQFLKENWFSYLFETLLVMPITILIVLEITQIPYKVVIITLVILLDYFAITINNSYFEDSLEYLEKQLKTTQNEQRTTN